MTLVDYVGNQPGIGVITLNDPDRLNAMSESMAGEFSSLINTLRPQASKLKCLILTGAGKAFSAGGDLKMLEDKQKLSGEENRLRMLSFYDSFLSILDLGVPIIAAINGAAIGAGLCLASACDIRIAAAEAKLGFTFAKIGLHPGMGATFFLPKVVGIGAASELLLTGRVIDANRALELGLVSKVVPAADVAKEANGLAQEICACGPEAIRQLVESLRGSGGFSLQQALNREASCQAINYRSEEFKEGVRATIEKRAPKF